MKRCIVSILFCMSFCLVAALEASSCPFCSPDVIAKQTVFETQYFYVFVDYAPVIEGHLLAIPKRHIAFAQELSREEWGGLYDIIPKVVKVFERALHTNQYVLLQKNGPNAGQSVPHVHFHLIPIPSKKLADEVKTAFFEKIVAHPPRRLEGQELENTINKYRQYFSESE